MFSSKVGSFGMRGSGQGQFKFPRGVAFDSAGNILVADSSNHRIQMFTASGQFIKAVGTQGNGPLQFSYPSNVMSNNSVVYVVDYGNHRVQVLNSDLTYSGMFGTREDDDGMLEFKSPRGIAQDSTGNVYVVNRGNHCIHVFTAEGKFLRRFGTHGEKLGELDGPFEIAEDDVVYVSEVGNNRVSIFTTEGRFVTLLGNTGEKPGEFKLPFGLAVDRSGVVYICDCGNNRVQVL